MRTTPTTRPGRLVPWVIAALTLAFAWRTTRSRFIAFSALVFLVFSFGFYGYHAAWTAECDALWAFFTTAYLFGLFDAVHRARPSASTPNA